MKHTILILFNLLLLAEAAGMLSDGATHAAATQALAVIQPASRHRSEASRNVP